MTRDLLYLLAASLFIVGLRMMGHPRTAVRGNLVGALGMLVAIGATLPGLGLPLLLVAMVVGSALGVVAATRVKMTAMPEMVGLLNGLGGAASVLVAGGEGASGGAAGVATAAGGLIGSVTFFGRYVAFGKLAEFLAVSRALKPWQGAVKYGFSGLVAAGALASAVGGNPAAGAAGLAIAGLLLLRRETFPGMNVAKAAVLLLALAAAAMAAGGSGYWTLVAVAGVLGVLLTWSIGGADMPVVIALLNSYSGLAAAATGFVIGNTVLIISGALVGASGIILSGIMCRAMNRSLVNVVLGAFGGAAAGPKADEVYRTVKATSAEEVAMLLESARRVVIVPGYGMAVAQAQHAVRDLANLVEKEFGAEVVYAIHPVAGRMPGHMNVLLAEADVPYGKLKELDEINAAMESTDVCIVVGANDVVNPLARTDPSSPIAGMPIVDADRARTCVVVKRSLGPGFAGIPNPLFAKEKTLMLFKDAREAFVEIAAAVKAR
ncbi:MAG: NAD(P)(+) transhydrogenase (Re/Si-specific) subunit beta [Planctomycetes bacterium]|nr:NAD(P)(+) transhydrogenase (Re/Si-specific) subunit beta [Planctomycetota bacterium]